MAYTEQLTLDIGGLAIDLALPAPWGARLRARYGAFLSGDAGRWRVALRYGWQAEPGRSFYVDHGESWTRFGYENCGGWLDLAGRTAQVTVASDADVLPSLERVLVYLCTEALPQEVGGLLLHASGVVWQARAHVFLGPSGAGKSTVAGLASGYGQVLCDENIVLRLGDAGPEAWSTPFWGQATPDTVARARQAAPLAALYALLQAPEFSLTPLSPAQAVLALIDSNRIAAEQPSRAAAWLAAAQGVLAQVPAYRLGFLPTAELWAFLDRASCALE
jgi:hypothetical protein